MVGWENLKSLATTQNQTVIVLALPQLQTNELIFLLFPVSRFKHTAARPSLRLSHYTSVCQFSWTIDSLDFARDLSNLAHCRSTSLALPNSYWIHWLRLGHSHLRDGQSDTAYDSTPTTLVVAPKLG